MIKRMVTPLLLYHAALFIAAEASGMEGNFRLTNRNGMAMFGAIVDGQEKGQIYRLLGVKKIEQICEELLKMNSFECVQVWTTGAYGKLLSEKGSRWLENEIQKVVDELRISVTGAERWTVAEDEPLIEIHGTKKKIDPGVRKHSYFAKEERMQLFESSNQELTGQTQMSESNRRGNFRRNHGKARRMISDYQGFDGVKQVRETLIVQHDAPPHLGALYAYAGGCVSRCKDPSTFMFTEGREDIVIYIVDGNVADHSEFMDIGTGSSRLLEEGHFSLGARENEGQACASDHGTHVASLAAGYESGVAKFASVISVAVQPGCGMPGYAADLEEGLDWILQRHQSKGGKKQRAIVSMSLIISKASASAPLIIEKVQELLANNIIVVAAAGNFHEDSCQYVPSGVKGVLTVAAADVSHDSLHAYPWPWSNFGTCVDIWAPGVNIEGASPDCFECSASFSGTSQATPLVTGLVAQFLANNPKASIDQVIAGLKEQAIPGLLKVYGEPYLDMSHLFAQAA